MAIYYDRTSAGQGGKWARIVLRYNEIMQQVSDKAREPGFSIADWDALAEVVEVQKFQRLGCFMETQNWAEYVAMLHGWGTATKFSSEFRRLIENDGLVSLELQENNNGGLVNSLSMYEINAAGKIERLHIYLQAPVFAPQ